MNKPPNDEIVFVARSRIGIPASAFKAIDSRAEAAVNPSNRRV